MSRKADKAISLIHIDRVVLNGSFQNQIFVELNYFENTNIWQVTDVYGGWCGTFLFKPKQKQHKIKAFRRWIRQRNRIRDINAKR